MAKRISTKGVFFMVQESSIRMHTVLLYNAAWQIGQYEYSAVICKTSALQILSCQRVFGLLIHFYLKCVRTSRAKRTDSLMQFTLSVPIALNGGQSSRSMSALLKNDMEKVFPREKLQSIHKSHNKLTNICVSFSSCKMTVLFRYIIRLYTVMFSTFDFKYSKTQ